MESKSLITHLEPKGVVSEAYRMLRTNLYYSNVDQTIKSILITSAAMAEGKTTTATNLAIAFAQSGKKTLYIDADLRKPRGYKLFGVGNTGGITSIITKKELSEAFIVQIKEQPGLYVLPSGPIPPNPTGILESNAMKELLEQVYNDFDIIIIDAPPVNSVTDASILARLVDGVLITISAIETHKDSARKAIGLLRKVSANILGAVFVKVPVNKKRDYKYYQAYGDGEKVNKKKKRKK